jgi:hypothetical protein
MTPEIHNRKALIAVRRAGAIGKARRIFQQVVDGSLDPYEGYRRLYGIYAGSSGLLDELKPFFRLPGVEPDGHLRVDDEFRATIRGLAEEWLRGEWPTATS